MNEKINQLSKALQTAEAVMIGAGSGLSASAGLVFTGERFQKHFSVFEQKYGFHDMYSGWFYPRMKPRKKNGRIGAAMP